MTKYTKDRIDELINWLQLYDVQCNASKLNRKFSDGVALANLFKKLYPRLIDLHNYPSQSSIRLKLSNWETLNTKILSKLGLNQSKTSLERLAKGEKNAIETLLFNVMKIEREREKKENKEFDDIGAKEHIILADNQKLAININKQIGDALVQVPQEMVLYSLYENIVKEIDKKKEIVQKLRTRKHLIEDDIEMLRNRIKNLTEQEDKLHCVKVNMNMKFDDGITVLLHNRRFNESSNSNSNNSSAKLSNKETLEESVSKESINLSTINLTHQPSKMDITISHDSQVSKKVSPPPPPSTSASTTCKSELIVKDNQNQKHNNNNKNNKNNMMVKITKIPTRNGQVLKSLRERYMPQHSRQHYRHKSTISSVKEEEHSKCAPPGDSISNTMGSRELRKHSKSHLMNTSSMNIAIAKQQQNDHSSIVIHKNSESKNSRDQRFGFRQTNQSNTKPMAVNQSSQIPKSIQLNLKQSNPMMGGKPEHKNFFNSKNEVKHIKDSRDFTPKVIQGDDQSSMPSNPCCADTSLYVS